MAVGGSVLSAAELFESTVLEEWHSALNSYDKVAELVSSERARKRKQTKKKDENESLAQLDQWYQTTLPDLVKSRDPPHMTQEELCRLMKWKLTRGKFRPRLTELIQQNTADTVREITEKAFSLMPSIEKAVQCLTQLKAVGPATASGILCVAFPDQVPFMADEPALAINEFSKLDYSLKQYLVFAKRIQEKAKQLNKKDTCKTSQDWTAHSVELSLWAQHFSHHYDITTIPQPPAKSSKQESP